MNDIMVDLETLGKVPGSVILSIGAIEFDPQQPNVFGNSFHRYIDIDSCLDAGLTVDGSTVKWWLRQSEAARTPIVNAEGADLRVALTEFAIFIGLGEPYVWAHPLSFDIPMLDVAYRKAGFIKMPGSYRKLRDTRTLFSLVPEEVYKSVPERGPAHDAYVDAERQARMVQAVYAYLKTAPGGLGRVA